MELTKSTSCNLLSLSENNINTNEYQDAPDLKNSQKQLFKFFSVSKNGKIIDEDLVIDETNEFLENLIEFKNESLKETQEKPEIDYDMSFIKSRNPFENVDRLYETQLFYKQKYFIMDHHNENANLNHKDSVSQEEIKNMTEGKVENHSTIDSSHQMNKSLKRDKQMQELVRFLNFFNLF